MKPEMTDTQSKSQSDNCMGGYMVHKLFDMAQLKERTENSWLLNERLEETLISLREKGSDRRLFSVTEDRLSQFGILRTQYPNFHHLVDWIEGRYRLCLIAGLHFSMPPINLDGPPGIGKTQFASQLSKALDLEFLQIPVGSMHGRIELVGGDPQWRSASVGAVAKGMLRCESANPLLFLDELCMVRDTDEDSVVQPLYQLLESEQRSHFRDCYLDLDMDLGQTNIITTTNDYAKLRPALKSRLTNFSIPAPGPAQMREITHNLYKEMQRDRIYCGILPKKLSSEIISQLLFLSPREAKQHLTHGVNQAILRGISASGRIRMKIQDLPLPASSNYIEDQPTLH